MSNEVNDLLDYSAALTAEEKIALIKEIITLPLASESQRDLVAIIVEERDYSFIHLSSY